MTVADRLRARLDVARALSVPIRTLEESDRSLFSQHLVELGPDDRYLRFGTPASDALIEQYVAGIDLGRDALFGVYDDDLHIVAAGHFAKLPDSSDEASGSAAEFGLSVSASARGRGLGTALFVRAATYARNCGVEALFMHCLSQNQAMMRIARRAGMQISSKFGEVDAFVKLPPADASSHLREAAQAQIAVFDYAVKRQLLQARRLDAALTPPALAPAA